ncbi:MAG: inorganic phosphate transporter [Acetobacteraceae bacterium]|nr:inorganic phosphate transporter [Acetobacteraceae bacterium]
MSDTTVDSPVHAAAAHHHAAHAGRPNLDAGSHFAAIVVFLALLVFGIGYTLRGLSIDISASDTPPLAIGAFVLLGIALLIALGFEFVNGFHDTANAVATVIYTHSLQPQVAVVWSGLFNFLGVLSSSGAVAFAIVSLLPVELILQVGQGAGFAMIFSLLIAAIVWNIGTWWLGLPASSSHTLIGSIMGVGVANQLMAENGAATSGVDWSQAADVFRALLFSPVVGFIFSALMLVVMKLVIKDKRLYQAPATKAPPPLWIRGLLVFTCTGVSFAHGSNDGQKGMGLIMLILIGAVPTAYALNRAVPDSHLPAFLAATQQVEGVFNARAGNLTMPIGPARVQVTNALKLHQADSPQVYAALASMTADVASQVQKYGTLNHVPAAAVSNIRNDMFMVSEAIRVLQKQGVAFDSQEASALKGYKGVLDDSTKFIPTWVKVAVAVALGLGTMVGWKRIVITVGEKIGKTHMTYSQGASAELVAAGTIAAATMYGLPVSTTHVLTSGVAGTMAAGGAGLQWATLRSLVMAWVLTLPAAILMAGSLYYLLRQVM